jgi:hypothetical protein
MRRVAVLALLVLAVVAVVGAGPAQAKLNPSFGEGGVVNVNPPLPPETTDQYVEGMAASRAGDSFVLSRASGCHHGVCTGPTGIFHYKPEGALDAAFAGGGVYQLPGEWEGVPALAVDSAGRPLIAVQSKHSGGEPSHEFTLTRLLASGQPDPSFGQGGSVGVPCQFCGFDAESFIPGAKGTFLLKTVRSVFGENGTGGGPTGIAVTLQSFAASGGVVGSYGSKGTATIGLPKKGSVAYYARTPEGGLYLGGEALYNRSGGGYLLRVSAKGHLDTRFLHAATHSLERLNGVKGFGTEVKAAVVRPQGKIDLFGSSGYSVGFELRLLANGKLDPKFGKHGLRMLPLPVSSAGLGSGGAEMAVSTENSSGAAVMRILPGGRVDPAFAGNGEGEPLPNAGGDAGVSIVPGTDKRAIVLDLGRHECRGYCPSTPKLFSFLEGR